MHQARGDAIAGLAGCYRRVERGGNQSRAPGSGGSGAATAWWISRALCTGGGAALCPTAQSDRARSRRGHQRIHRRHLAFAAGARRLGDPARAMVRPWHTPAHQKPQALPLRYRPDGLVAGCPVGNPGARRGTPARGRQPPTEPSALLARPQQGGGSAVGTWWPFRAW